MSTAALLCGLILCCHGESPSAQKAATASIAANQLTRRLESDVNTLNYVLQTTDYERNVLACLYDPLVDLDQDLRPIPGLAEKWEVSSDGRVYTFHLNPRATFSDRTPVLASDVIFTLRKIVDEPSQQFASNFENLDRTETKAIDSRTVRIVFRTPSVSQIYAFNIGVLPEHVYQKGNFKTDFNDHVIGAGPYTLLRRETGRSLLLQRRDDYWRSRPPIERILFKVIGDDATAWKAMQRGELDEMRVTADRWWETKDRADVTRNIVFASFYLLSYNCIAWNARDSLFSDKRIRRALSMTFDRKGIIEQVYHGQARTMTGAFTPDQWANDPNIAPPPYDPEGARKLLMEAGLRSAGEGIVDRKGRPFAFDVIVPAGSSTSDLQMQIFQAALKKIGITMNIRPMDSATMFDAVMKGNYQAAFLAWSVDPEPDLYSLFHSSQLPPRGLNIVDYRNPEVDRLIQQGRHEFDTAKRASVYHRLHAILADDQPYTWTVQVSTKWALNKRVRNAAASRGFGFYLWYPGPLAWSLASD